MNDIVEFQRLGAFHAASAMECVVKGGSAHLRMAVWHQNHAAHYYGNARGMLTQIDDYIDLENDYYTKNARIAELEAKLSAAEVEIERVWAITRGLDRFADGHELKGRWLEELKALKKAVEKKGEE